MIWPGAGRSLFPEQLKIDLQNKLSWPLPNYAMLKEQETPPHCTIVLLDNTSLDGELSLFDPEHEKLEVLAGNGQKPRNIEFGSIRYVQLNQPIRLTSSTVVDEAQGIFKAPELRTCTIEFKDGQVLNADTFGMIKISSGIYLYMPKEKHYIRRFIPIKVVKDYSIGAPLGKMLVEENLASADHVEKGLQKQMELRERQLGQYLTEDDIISTDQLGQALTYLHHQPMKKLGEALLDAGLITQEQLDQALGEQKQNRRRSLGSILVEMGVVDEATVVRLLARKLGIPFINLSRFNIDINVLKLVPEALATKYNLMPLGMLDQRIFIAMENPWLHEALNEVRFHSKKTAEAVMASGDEIRTAIKSFYGGDKMEELASELSEALEKGITNSEGEGESEEPHESDNTLTRLVNKIIMDAHQQGASDIHIESYPGRKNSLIRFRKDGVMVHYFNLPSNYRSAMVSRIKIMAGLDISEKRKGQDGKIDFSRFGPLRLELRVATIPTTNGLEDVVLRLLAGGKPIPLDKIGLTEENYERVTSLAQRPHGIFLVCGPTGSGKTTTLHSVLGFINNSERKIWTAEDPIEITQEGLRQVQVNPKIGWTFATTLRSFLRADPDVIMVGEMRDKETAQIGVEASLTGHMVLSTLHTNSAPESVVRLLDMGVDSFNFADALLGVLAQRLARRLCADCKKPQAATQEEIDALIAEYCEAYEIAHCPGPDRATLEAEWRQRYGGKDGTITLYRAVGCPKCDKSGYKGRLGLHELLFATPEVKRLIQNRAPVSEILVAALDAGMRTLKQDGIVKVLRGDTDISKVRAIC